MRRGRQPGRSSANDGAVAGSSRDREEQWEPQPSTSQAGGDDSADDDATSSDGGADYRLMSPRPSSAAGYSPSGGYGSSSPAGVGSEAEPHRTWPMLSGRRAGGGGSGDASPSGSDLLCPPDLQAMPLSPLPGPSGVQDPMAQPVYQADTAGVLLRSPPADSYLVSSSTGPLDGPASVRSDAPPPTPGMSAMIDSTVDDAESTRNPHLDGSESDDEPDDGISSGSAGRLNLASTAAPDPADDPSEPASLAVHSPEPGPSGLAAGRSVDPGGGRRAEAGAGGGAQLPVVTAGHHLVTDSVIMAPVHERYEPDTGGSALVIYDYLEELPADGRDPSDSALESPPSSSARLARHEQPAVEEECVSHETGEDGGMAEGALRLAPDEREALRRERSESRLGSRSRRPEPPLLRLPRTRQRSHQHHQHQHQHQHHPSGSAQDDLGRQHNDDDDDDEETNHHRDHLLSAERPDLLVPLPPDSDSEPEPGGDGSGGERGMLAMACDGDVMACDGDEALLPLDGGQEGLFEREAALSDVDSEDGVDGHAVILADEGQYRLSETDEEPDTVEPVMHVEQAEEPESGGPSAHPEDGEAAGAGGVSGLRPADLSQLPFIYLTDGLDIGLDAEDGGGDASGREPGASHLLVQVPPAYERQQAHQNDFWCEECCAYYRGRCPDHQVRLISDRPMQSRAWASLPTSHLAIRAVGTAADPTGETVYGVTAKKTIPKRTQFGPMEGILVKRDRGVIPANPSGLVLSVDNGGQLHTVDVSNPDCSNWMRFVRRAETPEQQNLVLNQQGSHLFLTSSRAIEPREELRAGYSLPYAARRGLAMLVAKPDGAAEPTPCGDGAIDDTSAAGPGSGGAEEGMDVVDPTEPAQPEQEEQDGPDDPDDPDWPLTCDRCGRCFVNLSAVERHDCEAPEEEGEEGVAEDEEDGGEEEEEDEEPPSRQRPPQRRGRGRPVKARQTTARQADKAASRWLCQYCPLSFESASTLNLHTLAHAAQDLEDSTLAAGEDGEEDGMLGGLAHDQPLDCPECNKEFLDKDELISHVASHGTEAVAMEEVEDVPTDESRPYKCHPCQRTFTHEEWLKRHLQSHVPDEEKPLVCGTCERRFVTTAALQCHRRVHSAAARRFQCPLCRAMFEQVTSLKEHVRTHATDGKYVCPHCGKSFDGYMTIRKHIRSFHNERVFVCSLCYKLCQSTDKLKQHMLKHSDHREFLCSECGKQFKRKDKLKEHVKRIHSLEKKVATERKARKKKLNAREEQLPPKVPPTDYHRFIYKCHKCKLGFKRRGMLVNHLAKRHPGMGPEQVPELMLPILKTTKDFYCQYCYKTYKSSSKRKAHILKIHPGAELPVSSRGVRLPIGETTDQTSFSQTVGSVTMSPHACNWCHKQYASRAKLLQHQRKKHRELMPADTQTPKATLRPQGRRAARAAAAAEREFTGEMSSASEDGNLTAITPMDTAVSGPAVVVAPAHTAVVPTPATLSAVSVAEVTLAAPVTAPMGTPMSVVAAPMAVATNEFHAGQPLIVQSAHPALIQETGQPLQLDQANLLGAGVELHSLDYRLCQPAGAGGPSGELCRVWTVHSTR